MPPSFNPWFSIWVKPRQTIKTIIQTNPKYRLFWLMFFYGFNILFSFSISFASAFSTKQINPYLSFGLSLLFAPLAGYLIISAVSWFIYKVGRWFKGKAAYQHVRASVAWSSLPAVVNSLVFFTFLFAGGYAGDIQSLFTVGLPVWLSAMQFTLSIWGFILFVLTLSEVQDFSKVKAFFNLLVGSLILGLLIFLVMMTVGLVVGGFNVLNVPQVKTFPGAA
jgi:hypothetical protein